MSNRAKYNAVVCAGLLAVMAMVSVLPNLLGIAVGLVAGAFYGWFVPSWAAKRWPF